MSDPIAGAVDFSKIDATRYALIRRLGFVFRHQLTGSLQPLNLACRVMQLKLKACPLDLYAIGDSVNQVTLLGRTAVDSCLDVVSWIAMDGQSTAVIAIGIDECLSRLRSSFSLRGITIRYEGSDLEETASESALREVFTAAMIAAADHAHGRGEMVVDVQPALNAVEIAVEMSHGANTSTADQEAYRLLEWEEVDALALNHGFQLQRASPERFKILIPSYRQALV